MTDRIYNPGTFTQKIKKLFDEKDGLASSKIIACAFDNNDIFYASTDCGVFRLDGEKFCQVEEVPEPVVAFCKDSDGILYAASGKNVFCLKNNRFLVCGSFKTDVDAITAYEKLLFAADSNNIYVFENGLWQEYMYLESRVSSIAFNGEYFCMCSEGVLNYIRCKRKIWQNLIPSMSGIPQTYVNDIAFDGIGYLWLATDNGLMVYDNLSKWLTPENSDILPAEKIYHITTDSEGGRWLSSDNGIIYEKNGGLKYLGYSRWVPATDVRCIAVSSDCSTVFAGTDCGLSRITFKKMSLLEKADYYLNIANTYQKREGYVTKRYLTDNTDFNSGYNFISDNDGLWTERYIAAESYRYAVTGDKSALENARESMKSMFYLMKITGIPGFVARAIRRKGEMDYGDGNHEWHLSADGSCEWKGETSSDEITGHFFGMNVYYKLCANDDEKKEICSLLCGIIDHALKNNYKLCDVDGKPTSWANWSPDSLNSDEKWAWENGINSFEFLSYLKTVYNMSGNDKYLKVYNKLIKENHYAINLVTHKKYDAHVTHIDDQLAFLTSVTFLSNEDDVDVRRLILMAMERHFRYERIECTPMWNFIYSVYTDRCADIDGAVRVLGDMPLDLVNCKIVNSTRKGLVYDTEQEKWGEAPQLLKPLPIDERPFYQDDSGTFKFDARERHSLEDAGVYLLPYWYARYHKIISE